MLLKAKIEVDWFAIVTVWNLLLKYNFGILKIYNKGILSLIGVSHELLFITIFPDPVHRRFNGRGADWLNHGFHLFKISRQFLNFSLRFIQLQVLIKFEGIKVLFWSNSDIESEKTATRKQVQFQV